MAGRDKGIIDPPIDALLEKVDSKYQLVIYASKRARQINDYYSALFLMIRRPPRSTPIDSSAASDVYKRQRSTKTSCACATSTDSSGRRRVTPCGTVHARVSGMPVHWVSGPAGMIASEPEEP